MKNLKVKYNDFISNFWVHENAPTYEKILERLYEKIDFLERVRKGTGVNFKQTELLYNLKKAKKIIETDDFLLYFDFRSDTEFEENYGRYEVKNKDVETVILYKHDNRTKNKKM